MKDDRLLLLASDGTVGETKTNTKRWPTLVLAVFCIALHGAGAYWGLSLFRHPRGSYFAICGERLMMVFVVQVGFFLALAMAALPGAVKARILRFVVSIVCLVSSYLLHWGIERMVFKTMEFME